MLPDSSRTSSRTSSDSAASNGLHAAARAIAAVVQLCPEEPGQAEYASESVSLRLSQPAVPVALQTCDFSLSLALPLATEAATGKAGGDTPAIRSEPSWCERACACAICTDREKVCSVLLLCGSFVKQA
jgi:hypothetical protein